METLKENVEKTIRKFYGFDSNIDIKDVDVQFNVATQTNGILQMVSTPEKTGKRPHKKKKAFAKAASKSLHRDYSTSLEDIACIRHFFAKWERDKTLTEGQQEFLNTTKGFRYPRLTEETKEEMLRLFYEHRTSKLMKNEEANA